MFVDLLGVNAHQQLPLTRQRQTEYSSPVRHITVTRLNPVSFAHLYATANSRTVDLRPLTGTSTPSNWVNEMWTHISSLPQVLSIVEACLVIVMHGQDLADR